MFNRIHILTRLIILLSVNILALTFDKVSNLIYLAIFSIFIWSISKPTLDRIKFTLMIVLPTMWSFILLQGLFYSAEPKTVLLVIVPPNFPIIGKLTGGLYLIYQGLIYGLIQSLRMISVILVGLSVAWSSTETEVFRILRRYLKSVKITVAVGVAVRFLDQFLNELKIVITNYRLTCKSRNPIKMMKSIVIPLIAQIIRRAYTLTLALIYRGYLEARQVQSVDDEEFKLTLVNKLIVVISLSIAVILAILKILTLLFLYGIVYIPQLVYVYTWVVNNL